MIEDRGFTQARLAREWNVPAWNLRAVIHRHPEVVYQPIREKLAEFLGVPVSDVGREPAPKKQATAQEEAAA